VSTDVAAAAAADVYDDEEEKDDEEDIKAENSPAKAVPSSG
jgi:hypothetical protein